MKKLFLTLILVGLISFGSYCIYYNITLDDLMNKISYTFSNLHSYVSNIFSGDIDLGSIFSDVVTSFDIDIDGILVSDNDVSSLEDYGVSYQEIDFDSTYYPYYAMLNSDEKKLYNQLYANINSSVTAFKPNVTLNIDDVHDVIEAVYNDHPEFFWLDSTFTYKYTRKKECVQINLEYNDTLNYKDIFDSKADAIISVAKNLETTYEKEKYVHDKLVSLITFNEDSTDNQSAFSALVNNSTVCAGYARAFQYIMINLGIPCYYASGYGENDGHAWNIVMIDGEFYNVDLTWDDQTDSYEYFNVPDSIFNENHTRTSLSLNLPECKATKYYNRQLEEINYERNNKVLIPANSF